ncbi:unnamed protein product [Prunus brigantina]
MASRAQKIANDLNTTITNLGFERLDPPVILAPTTVQDEFNLALGHPLVTEVMYKMGLYKMPKWKNGFLYNSSIQNGFVEKEFKLMLNHDVQNHNVVVVPDVVDVPEVVADVVDVPDVMAMPELEEGVIVNIYYMTRLCRQWETFVGYSGDYTATFLMELPSYGP